MLRVVVLVLLSGCQLVFSADPAEPPSACGRFEIEEEQVFADLAEVVELSVDAGGMLGFAKGIRTGTTFPLLYPVRRDGAVWIVDDSRLRAGAPNRLDELQMDGGMREGRATAQGHLFAGELDLFGQTGSSRAMLYKLGPNGWAAQEPPPTDFVALDLTVPGGAVELVDELAVTLRQVPVLHRPEVGERFVTVFVQFDDGTPPLLPWEELADDGALATAPINAAHEHVDQASLALGPNGDLVMAYQATDNGSARLYLTEKSREVFPRGVRLVELDGPGDEVEPFLTPDCSALYFRRGAQIFRAISGSP